MNFKRLATGEKYGMTKCSVHSPEIVEINLVGDNLERLEHADRNALLEAERNDRNLARLAIENAESDLLQKTLNVRGYTDSTQEFEDLRKIFRLRARLNMPVYAEADEFANKTQIGPLQFRDWKKIAINLCAIGATKAHLEDRSLARSGKLTKINFLENPPILISKEELELCFRIPALDEDPRIRDEILSCFLLDPKYAHEMPESIDAPAPLLVSVQNEILMPRYSRIGNPYAFLLYRLKKIYDSKMSRVKDDRERQFRNDLERRLDSSKYFFVQRSLTLRRSDKSILTDVDAAVYEKQSNTLYFIQLKWLAVLARDIRTRESQYTNLINPATEWVGKVHNWIALNSSKIILEKAGLRNLVCDDTTFQIRLMVVHRWWTRFSGKPPYDNRATWLSWPRFSLLLRQYNSSNCPLSCAWHNGNAVDGLNSSEALNKHSTYYNFPGLKVVISSEKSER